MRGGISVVQRKWAYGHRVWKLQPGGGATGLGISPLMTSLRRLDEGSGTGTAAMRALVYGCKGFLTIVSVLPSSTIFPRYMTATRLQTLRAKARSWVTNRTDAPLFSTRESIKAKISALIETSSIDTGSSATMKSG